MTKRKIAILGATGSIGQNALRVIRNHSDKLELLGIAGGSRVEPLAQIAREFDVKEVALFHHGGQSQSDLKQQFPADTNLYLGKEGLHQIATLEEADLILIAVVGVTALEACISAIQCNKMIALASKEILVMAGEFVMPLIKENDGIILPTDSEHNAIFQCLNGSKPEEVKKIIVTASGGQFFDKPKNELANITPEDATKHPNWSMGAKVTIDSSTMANKGLEIIEAKWLFDLRPDQIEVVIHRQSIIHSMVQFVDGSIISQMSPPSMTFPIQHCLLYPDRHEGVDNTLNFKEALRLDFQAPCLERFPCLRLAFESLEKGMTAPAIFNAANEVAVQAFVDKKLSYLDIPKVIEFTLQEMTISQPHNIEEVIAVDRLARDVSKNFISQ